ncbi:hypothetical protein HD598_000891 [Neomicrococcus aestuarii]|uniref:Uncharacterized protein n=1 Tax=Neomicrococcus aestuarii TaxID=556325 RepID=A0A7W8TSV9_9MICC|nr:hypothetical protein [Neomicrococcus aestuarii]
MRRSEKGSMHNTITDDGYTIELVIARTIFLIVLVLFRVVMQVFYFVTFSAVRQF